MFPATHRSNWSKLDVSVGEAMVGVSPSINLDVGQLEVAARMAGRPIRILIEGSNNYMSPGYDELPVQLRPYQVNEITMSGPPRAGIWRTNQRVWAMEEPCKDVNGWVRSPSYPRTIPS